MGNCLKTQLKATVNNSNLPFFNAKTYSITGDSSVVNRNNVFIKGCSVIEGTVYQDAECTTVIANPVNMTTDFYIKGGDVIKVKLPYATTQEVVCINSTFTCILSDFNYFETLYGLSLRFTNSTGDLKGLLEHLSEFSTFGTISGHTNIAFDLRNTVCTFNGSDAGTRWIVTRANNILSVYKDSLQSTPVTYNIDTKTWDFSPWE